MNKCKECGVTLKKRGRTFCSYKCSCISTGRIKTKRSSLSTSCHNCGEKITRKKSLFKNRKHIFCNFKCRDEYRHKSGFENRKCTTCKKWFEVNKRNKTKFCSANCVRRVKFCELCGDKFVTKNGFDTLSRCCCLEHLMVLQSNNRFCKFCNALLHRREIYCSLKCEAEDFKIRLKGKNNPNYGKGEKVKKLWKNPNSKYRKRDITGKNNPNWGNGQAVGKRWKEGRYDKMLLEKPERFYLWSKGTFYKGIWMRSSWELAYAKYLDKKGIKWQHECKRFILRNGQRFVPDFFLPKLNEWHEVKGWMDKRGVSKIRRFREQYPEEKLIIINKPIWKKDHG